MIKALFLFALPILQFQENSKYPDRVLVFYLPMESDYFAAIDTEDIIGHRETKILETSNKSLRKKFVHLYKELQKNAIDSEYHYIDVRVYIQLTYGNEKEKQLLLTDLVCMR